MRRAEHLGVPFWPAASVHDIPYLIFDWYDIRAEAEHRAKPPKRS